MASLIQEKSNAQALTNGLKAMGWSPTLATINTNFEVRGYTIGVLLKVGDPRIKWEEGGQAPVIDFFKMIDMQTGAAPSTQLKPVDFSYAHAGTDTIEIRPKKNERIEKFCDRLRAIAVKHPEYMMAVEQEKPQEKAIQANSQPVKSFNETETPMRVVAASKAIDSRNQLSLFDMEMIITEPPARSSRPGMR